MLKIDVISVQPKMFAGFLTESIVARAVKKGACEVNIVDLREFGEGRWRKVDDSPYGGGPGMLMKCGPWFAAVESRVGESAGAHLQGARTGRYEGGTRVVMTSPAGRKFTQRDAESLAEAEHVVFMCGHYEGFDARVRRLVTDEVSLGDFVLTGGEIPVAAMVDSVVRLLPGVLGGGAAATANESFGADGLLEAPQYTRPPSYRGLSVPPVLVDGNHAAAAAWRRRQAVDLTGRQRPDLLAQGGTYAVGG
jgi:tRNA (guanine37-N1)-methyltransferase